MAIKFTKKRRIQFAETDLAGVLHFSNYFRLMEEVEHDFWRSLNLSVLTQHHGHEVSWPRVSVQCEYADPLHFEDVVDLTLSVTKIGTKSITFTVAFSCDGRRVAVGTVTAVCCTWGDGSFRSIAIPESLRSLLVQSGDDSPSGAE